MHPHRREVPPPLFFFRRVLVFFLFSLTLPLTVVAAVQETCVRVQLRAHRSFCALRSRNKKKTEQTFLKLSVFAHHHRNNLKRMHTHRTTVTYINFCSYICAPSFSSVEPASSSASSTCALATLILLLSLPTQHRASVT